MDTLSILAFMAMAIALFWEIRMRIDAEEECERLSAEMHEMLKHGEDDILDEPEADQ